MYFLLLIPAFGIFLVIISRVWVVLATQNRIDKAKIDFQCRIAVVFGAGLNGDGRISTVLSDRVKKAVTLWNERYVTTLFLTGAAKSANGNEVKAMQSLSLAFGINPAALQIDEFGNRSIISWMHIKQRFPETPVVLITQKFHLPRVLFIAKWMGIDATGVSSDLSSYPTGDEL